MSRRARLRNTIGLVLALGVFGAAVAMAADGPAGLRLGVSHGQHSLNPWMAPVAVESGRQVLATAPGTLQNQHLMGWGSTNPEPFPGHRDWSSLDRRMKLVRETGGTPVITLCCAPDWMKGGIPGRTDWSRLEAAPMVDRFDEFAALAAATARRYPDVRHYQVWNEMKGFWDPFRNRWRYEDYTNLYNQVYRALKAVNPAIQVGGPYVPMTTWRPDVGGGRDSELRGPWGMVDQRALDVVQYWLEHAVGADFISVDGSTALRDGTYLVPPIESAAKFRAIDEWLRARTSLPIWWSEVAPVPYGSSAKLSPQDLAAVWLATIRHLEESGAAVALLWQPESNDRHVGLWTAVDRSTGGRPTPLRDVLAPWLG